MSDPLKTTRVQCAKRLSDLGPGAVSVMLVSSPDCPPAVTPWITIPNGKQGALKDFILSLFPEPDQEYEEFKPRIFTGEDGKPYMCKRDKLSGDVWMYYLHPDSKWVTIQKVHSRMEHHVPDDLSDEQQKLYPEIS